MEIYTHAFGSFDVAANSSNSKYDNTILVEFIDDISHNTENKIEIENVSLFFSSNENEVQIPFDPYFENLHFLSFSIDSKSKNKKC